MLCYKDMTFCPEEYASGCTKGNTCERAWTALKQQQAERWMSEPPVCFFTDMPKCYEGQPIKEKYHQAMSKVHAMLRRHAFKGPYPDYTTVKYLCKRGFSIYEIGMESICTFNEHKGDQGE